ncbi:MAG: PQQ-binding-like beta-propeller repeat protein, partial [Desulfovibrionales bacterium]|nr:PQQ-binding-like beta-propeller repeat protein [Desulfovibrionales bacterium]
MERISGDDIPPITHRSIEEERQNFANWFTFHRKRIYSAINTLATTINTVDGINLGIYTANQPETNPKITDPNEYIIQPVLPLGIQSHAHSLQNKLYRLQLGAQFSSPLRVSLQKIGQYFDASDKIEPPGLGASPYLGQENGGSCQQAVAIIVSDGYWTGRSPNLGDQDKDGHKNTLADVAMYYYKTDLSPLPNQVHPSKIDSLSTQHMVTYAISYNAAGNLDPNRSPDCPTACDGLYPNCEACPPWPQPRAHEFDEKFTYDLYHATVNGRGKLWSGQDPEKLSRALDKTVKSISNQINSRTALGMTAKELAPQATLFQATFTTAPWTGDLKAYGINSQTGIPDNTQTWSACQRLKDDLKKPEWWRTGRKIFTAHQGKGLAFSNEHAADIGLPREIIDYIRGNHIREGSGPKDFRPRPLPLGDIVNSSPHHANGLVFVGANDGMLHAFDAKTGEERFAYIPSLLIPKLPQLTKPHPKHLYFVDQTPHSKATDDKTTYLVGGLKKGGKGYYCLDISPANLNPGTEALAASTLFKWEYPMQDDPD